MRLCLNLACYVMLLFPVFKGCIVDKSFGCGESFDQMLLDPIENFGNDPGIPLRFSSDQIPDRHPLKSSWDRLDARYSSLNSSTDSLNDEPAPLRRVRSCISFESGCLSGVSSPLRPASPFSLERQYLEVGSLARPGAGTSVSEDQYHVISSAVKMAAYMTPEMGSNTFESIKRFCKRHYKFPEDEERHEGDWSTLENSLMFEQKKSFKLIAYGSLIDPESSTEFSTKGDPVLAFGVKRDTSFLPPSPETSPLGIPPSPYEKDLLRFAVDYTGDYDNAINGLLLEVKIGEEFDALRVRERGYDLIKVPVVRFESKEGFKMYLEEAYILAHSVGNKENKMTYNPKEFSPHMAYLYICLRGAMNLSKRMPKSTHALSVFLSTTYVGDKRLGDWLRERPLEGSNDIDLSPRAYFQKIRSSDR